MICPANDSTGRRSGWRRPQLTLALVACLACLAATPAAANTATLGPPTLQASTGAATGCVNGGQATPPCRVTLAQLSVPPSSNNILVSSPGDGTISSWSVVGRAGGTTNVLALRVLRPAANGAYTAVGSSDPVAAGTDSATTQASTNLPIEAGDFIGVDASTDGSSGAHALVDYTQPANAFSGVWSGGLADGMTSAPPSQVNERLQLNATIALSVPVITGVSPAAGSLAGGEAVTVEGQHLAGASQVLFGSNAAAISSNTNSRIVVTAPAGGTGPVDVRVSAPGGTSAAGTADRYTYANPGGGPGPPPDTTRPRVSSFLLSPRTFVAANSGPGIVPGAAVGTHVVYRVSETARTTLRVERRSRGVRKGRRCVAGRARHGHKRCIRYVRLNGKLTHADATGLNAFRFMGRIRGKSLKPGRYRLVVVAHDVAGNASAPARRAFRITR